MSKKAILFIDKVMSAKSFELQQSIKKQGYITLICDGNFTSGFKDSCSAICMEKEFPHIRAWAEESDIEIISFEEKKKPVHTEPVKTEEKPVVKTEEEPKATNNRRGRKPKSEEGNE